MNIIDSLQHTIDRKRVTARYLQSKCNDHAGAYNNLLVKFRELQQIHKQCADSIDRANRKIDHLQHDKQYQQKIIDRDITRYKKKESQWKKRDNKQLAEIAELHEIVKQSNELFSLIGKQPNVTNNVNNNYMNNIFIPYADNVII